jgi:hypothetical protein
MKHRDIFYLYPSTIGLVGKTHAKLSLCLIKLHAMETVGEYEDVRMTVLGQLTGYIQVPDDIYIYIYIYMSRNVWYGINCCALQGLGPLTCPDSELTAETMNPFRHFDRTPWTGDRSITKPLPTQERTTQKNLDLYQCLKRDSKSRYQCSNGPRSYRSASESGLVSLLMLFN